MIGQSSESRVSVEGQFIRAPKGTILRSTQVAMPMFF